MNREKVEENVFRNELQGVVSNETGETIEVWDEYIPEAWMSYEGETMEIRQ